MKIENENRITKAMIIRFIVSFGLLIVLPITTVIAADFTRHQRVLNFMDTQGAKAVVEWLRASDLPTSVAAVRALEDGAKVEIETADYSDGHYRFDVMVNGELVARVYLQDSMNPFARFHPIIHSVYAPV